MEVALDFSLISIRKKRSRRINQLPFHDFDGKGANALQHISASLQPLTKGNWKEITKKSLSAHFTNNSNDQIKGIIKVGEYGTSNDLIDTNTGQPAFNKKTFHAEQIPFYFEIRVPVGSSRGFFVTERQGVHGVSSIIGDIIRDYFVQKFPDYVVDINTIVPDFIFDQMLANGTPKSVTFVKNSIPSDFADIVSGKRKNTKGRVEVKISSSDLAIFRKSAVRQTIKSKKDINTLYSFSPFEPDDVKMKIEIGGKTRTISLQKVSLGRSSFDISNNISYLATGYGDPSSIAKESHSIMKTMSKAAGIKI